MELGVKMVDACHHATFSMANDDLRRRYHSGPCHPHGVRVNMLKRVFRLPGTEYWVFGRYVLLDEQGRKKIRT
jgi:hypothetical protein